MTLRSGLYLSAILLVSTGANAQSASQSANPSGSAANVSKPLNPNEMVCEREQEPGSRLAAAKVCHTRAEWADLKSQDRQDVERVQTQRGVMAPH